MNTTRVLIVDDITEVRSDLQMLLQLIPEIEVVGEAADGLAGIREFEAVQPEVILMDLEMPVMDGYEATQRIKGQDPGCRVVALTVHDCRSARERAAQAGADAFIVKGAPVTALLRAILEKRE